MRVDQRDRLIRALVGDEYLGDAVPMISPLRDPGVRGQRMRTLRPLTLGLREQWPGQTGHAAAGGDPETGHGGPARRRANPSRLPR
jgi:hypothetical protein